MSCVQLFFYFVTSSAYRYMKKILLALVAGASVLLLTRRHETDDQPIENPPVVVDPVAGIAVSTRDNTARMLSVFNPDGSLRWEKKVGPNNGLIGQISYHRGILFHSYGLGIYAYDIKTGVLLWKGFDFMTASRPTVENAVLYSCTDTYELLEIDPTGGARLKNPSVLVGDLVPYPPLIKDGIAYVVASTPLAYYSVKAIDIKTGVEKWAVAIGYNPPRGLRITGTTLSLINGGAQLKGININTGTLQWELNDHGYFEYITDGDVIYALWGDRGIAAIDVHTGAKRWQREIAWPANQLKNLYLYKEQVIFQLVKGGNSFLMTAINSTHGDSLWSKPQGYFFPDLSAPIISGDKLFQFRTDMFEPYETKIMIYDPATYNRLDSIDVEGESFEDLRIITESEN